MSTSANTRFAPIHADDLVPPGPVVLGDVQAAAPCVEFSKFCAGYPVERQADSVITETLRFLHQGMRGFYATVDSAATTQATIALGDMAWVVTT